MKVTIKITDDKAFGNTPTVEIDIGDARKLWIELGKIFGDAQETAKFKVPRNTTWPPDYSNSDKILIKPSESLGC